MSQNTLQSTLIQTLLMAKLKTYQLHIFRMFHLAMLRMIEEYVRKFCFRKLIMIQINPLFSALNSL